jgi:REP element-mobilizing transposase RayT
MPATYTKLLYHIVFSTKKRSPLISESWEKNLHKYMGGIIRGEGGSLLEVGGTSDHVHLLVKLKPTKAVSDIVRVLKANSSKWVNEQKRLRKFGWQDGYAAFTVSQSQAPKLREYIQNQKKHRKKKDYKAELLALLERHEIEFEERYLWD